MAQGKWLLKSEPGAYSWDDLLRDGSTVWDGVRNHRAANNLRAMQAGDQAFFYHSVTDKHIVGIAEVIEAGLADPKDAEGRWAAVRISALRPLLTPVSLAAIKAEKRLTDMELVRLSRLSVASVTDAEWNLICEMGFKT